MVIGFYITDLIPGEIGGAEQYTRNLINELVKLGNKCILFVNEQAYDSFDYIESIVVISLPRVGEGIIHDCIEYYIRQEHIEAICCPLSYIPHGKFNVPIITTILDLQYKVFPEYFTANDLKYRDREISYAIRMADSIITISEFSKDSIREEYPDVGKTIDVVYLGADRMFDIEKISSPQIGVTKRFLLFPANSWPHKNHKALLHAFYKLIYSYHQDIDLVFTGNISRNVIEEIAALKLEDRVHVLGYLKQQDIPGVYKMAYALAFPSLYEGFGMPLVEAMQMGLPIACSDCASIPEVAGDAALYFDANDESDIAEKLFRIINDDKLRELLVSKGKLRCKQFTFNQTAVDTEKHIIDTLENYSGKKNEVNKRANKARFLIYVFDDGNEDDLRKTVESLYDQRDIEVTIRTVREESIEIETDSDLVGVLKAGEIIYKDRLIVAWLAMAAWGGGVYYAPYDDNGIRNKVIELGQEPKHAVFMSNAFIGQNFCLFKVPKSSVEKRVLLLKDRLLNNYLLYSLCEQNNYICEFGDCVLGRVGG